MIWTSLVEAAWTGLSCNFPLRIWLHCGGSCALPCHLLVCVWFDVCPDVCVSSILGDAQPSEFRGCLDVLQPPVFILCAFSCFSYIFTFWFVTFRTVTAQSISHPSHYSSVSHSDSIFFWKALTAVMPYFYLEMSLFAKGKISKDVGVCEFVAG